MRMLDETDIYNQLYKFPWKTWKGAKRLKIGKIMLHNYCDPGPSHYIGKSGAVARWVACLLGKQRSRDQSSCPAHFSFREK